MGIGGGVIMREVVELDGRYERIYVFIRRTVGGMRFRRIRNFNLAMLRK